MNFADIKAEVLRRVKITTVDTVEVEVVEDLINRAFYDLVRELRPPQFLKTETELDLTNAETGIIIQLPTDFIQLVNLYFANISTPQKRWRLDDRKEITGPAPLYGFPSTYMVQSPAVDTDIYGLRLYPYAEINIYSRAYLDYIYVPAVSFEDQSNPLSLDWDSEIIKRACQAYLIRDNKTNIAQAMSNPAAASANSNNNDK